VAVRRLLLMVQELHRMGYERLRVVTGMSPSGCYWRLAITPATNVRPADCGERYVNYEEGVARYTTGQEANCFGWEDAAKDSPEQLADKFVQRFSEIVVQGKGSDPDYARWYAAMIEATEPHGLMYMYADYGWYLPSEHVPVLNVRKEVYVSRPPQVDTRQTAGECRLWCDSKAATVGIDPTWLTSNVIALAQTIHDERAFDRLPVLGDALEEGGCTNDDILKHCRQPGKHVAGCSLIDLLLKKM
jgi:hypothetical protein